MVCPHALSLLPNLRADQRMNSKEGIMTQEDLQKPGGEVPYVFASGTTPHAALDARVIVREVFGACDLRAVQGDEFFYDDPEWGFTFVDLSRDDPIESRIAAALEDEERWMRELSERSPALHIIDPVSLLVVCLSAVAAAVVEGAGQEAGKDLYHAGEGLAKRAVRRKRPKHSGEAGIRSAKTPLHQLFESLGTLYAQEYVQGAPMFIRLLGPDVTFLCEPMLPPAAIQAAAALVLGNSGQPAAAATYPRPLRWNAASGGWEMLPPNWADRMHLLALKHELQERVAGMAS